MLKWLLFHSICNDSSRVNEACRLSELQKCWSSNTAASHINRMVLHPYDDLGASCLFQTSAQWFILCKWTSPRLDEQGPQAQAFNLILATASHNARTRDSVHFCQANSNGPKKKVRILQNDTKCINQPYIFLQVTRCNDSIFWLAGPSPRSKQGTIPMFSSRKLLHRRNPWLEVCMHTHHRHLCRLL